MATPDPSTTPPPPSSSRPELPRLRTTSSSHSQVDIRSPIPDLQTMCGAYVKNIEKLEQSAEDLSQGGSDIGEEIRKMKQEQDRASRRSSLASRKGRSLSRQGSITAASGSGGGQQPGSIRSRNASTSSYANSIVDLNSTARWGGYSPSGYFTSPSVSRVSSFHRPSGLPEPVQEGRPLDSPLASPNSTFAPTRRPSQQSMARTDDIMSDHLDHPEDIREEREERDGHDEHDEHESDWEMMRRQHEEELPHDHDLDEPDEPEPEPEYEPQLPRLMDQYRSSTPDTYRQARSLFRDFDGVHFSPTMEDFQELDESGNEVPRSLSQEFDNLAVQQHQQQNQQQNHMLQQRMSHMSLVPRPLSYAHPPPGENMTYYPAPVPRMLNLPKRLSQLPAASVQAHRRSQVLSAVPVEARKSVAWLPTLEFQHNEEDEEDGEGEGAHSSGPRSPQSPRSPLRPSPAKQRQSMMNPRLSRMSMANLPPQLRASVYFDPPPVQQDIKIMESAGATLDSILAASVNAPVNVFTDHPFAGHVGSEVYGRPQPQRRSTLINFAKSANPETSEPQAAKGHERVVSSSTIGSPLQKRNSIVSMLTDLGNPTGNKLKKNNSRMSLATDLGLARGSGAHFGGDGDEHVTDHQGLEGDLEDGAEEGDYEEEQFDEKYPFYAQPTTLLAELQVRKAQQKTRNRTAYNGFPNGMHSTLLQLDAVAQIEKTKKQRQRTRLAWEDPMLQEQDQQEEDENEDVPLGVLYPEKNGLVNRKKTAQPSDWNKPLGLLERRELEDNEPLARRRNRLRGISPDHHLRVQAQQQALFRQQREAETAAATVPLPAEEEEDEHANETLGERLRRLKREEALNAALGDLTKGDESKRMSTFTDELLGQLGVVDSQDDADKTPEAKPADKVAAQASVETSQEHEGETLGQRRARLQREKNAMQQDAQRNVSNPDSAGASTVRPPLRDSVSLANLLAVHPVGANAGVSKHEPAAGSLLAASSKAEQNARKKLREQNARSTSYHVLPKTATTTNQSTPNFNPAHSYQQQLQMQQFAAQQQMYPQMHTGMGMGMMGGMQYNSMMYPQFAQPTAYTGMNMNMGMGMGLLQQQNMYGQMSAMQNYNTNMGMNGAYAHHQQMSAGQYGGYEEAQLNQGQRDLIDRWRLSVAQ